MKCDAKAFAKMYETVYRDLYRFALCTMKNSHDAEDAVSEAVMNAYEPVSYTHLDVYKRQVMGTTATIQVP